MPSDFVTVDRSIHRDEVEPLRITIGLYVTFHQQGVGIHGGTYKYIIVYMYIYIYIYIYTYIYTGYVYLYMCVESQRPRALSSISPKDPSPFTVEFKHVVLENLH